MKNRLFFESPLGDITLYSVDGKLCALQFAKEETCAPDAVLFETQKQLCEYFDGKRRQFDLPLLFDGTSFQKDVWNALLKIDYCQCVSYTGLAKLCGHATAVRAVGSAVGKNPIPIIVPCHRVVCADGSIGGFSCGLDKKRALMDVENIAHEGVKIQIFPI